MKKKVTQILSIALCMVLLFGSTVTANAAKKSSNTGAYQAVFDAEYYYNSNPDLQAAFGYDAQKLFNHFVSSGIYEGRSGCANFNVAIYRANYPDLQAAFGNDLASYCAHYAANGAAEGRNATTLISAGEGAQAAVDVIRKLCERIMNDRHLLNDIDTIKVYVVKRWKEQIESDWDEYATTVNFAIYVDHTLLTGQIGDGLIVAEVDGNSLVLTESDEFYSTETYALGAAVKKSTFTIRVVEVRNRIRVYMASDGIGKEINEASRIELIEYLGNMMMNEDAVIEDELDTWVIGLGKKNGDDKTIGFVSWEE